MIAAGIAPGARRHYFGFFGWWGTTAPPGTPSRAKPRRASTSRHSQLRGLDADAARARCGARKRRARRGRRSSSASNSGRLGRRRSPQASGAGLSRHQSALRRAPRRSRRRARADEGAGRRAARKFQRLGCGDSRRFAGCGARARHSRRARTHRVERRARMPPAATARLGRNRKAAAAHRPRARASTRRWPNRPARRCSATASRRISSNSSPGPSANSVSCYRLYDADMPEYSFAIDRYAEAGRHTRLAVRAGVRARRRPSSPTPCSAGATRHWPRCRASPACSAERIHLRQRRRTTRGDQYEKLGESGDFRLVEESGLQVLGQLQRLPGHGPVPRSPHHAAAAAATRRRASASSTCSPTPAAPRCTPRPAAPAKPRPSTCRPPTSIGLSAIWR